VAKCWGHIGCSFQCGKKRYVEPPTVTSERQTDSRSITR